MNTLAPSKNVSEIRAEIALADTAYANWEQTGELAGMSPHEMRSYIEVRENELHTRSLNS
jgi:hypothetical protein